MEKIGFDAALAATSSIVSNTEKVTTDYSERVIGGSVVPERTPFYIVKTIRNISETQKGTIAYQTLVCVECERGNIFYLSASAFTKRANGITPQSLLAATSPDENRELIGGKLTGTKQSDVYQKISNSYGKEAIYEIVASRTETVTPQEGNPYQVTIRAIVVTPAL